MEKDLMHPHGNCVVINYEPLSKEEEQNIRNYVAEFEAHGHALRVRKEHVLLGEIDRLRAELAKVSA
jgi:hypothetical protein